MLGSRGVLTGVAVLLVSVGLVTFDPNAPQAAALAGCTSSIDPKCAGANMWVLAEAAGGVGLSSTSGMAASTVTTAAVTTMPTAGVAAGTGSTAGLALNTAGALGAILSLGGAFSWSLGRDTAPEAVEPFTGFPEVGGTPVENHSWTWVAGQADPAAYIGIVDTVPGVISLTAVPYGWGTGYTFIGYSAGPGNYLCNGVQSGLPAAVSPGTDTGGLKVITWSVPTCGGTGLLPERVTLRVVLGVDGQPYSTVSVTFYRPGDPLYQEPLPDDAVRRAVSEVECVMPGGTVEVLRAESVWFASSELSAGFVIPQVPAVSCPENAWARSVTPGVETQGAGGTVTNTPLSAPVTPPQSVADRAEDLVNGTDPGLELWYIGGTSPQNCNGAGTLCRLWWDAPTRAQDYECRDGGQAVPILRCEPYRRFFEPNPEVADPANSNPQPEPSGEPAECFPTGWGMLNPVEWVLMPVRCALTWAFVPSPGALEAAAGTVQDATVGTAYSDIGGVFATLEAVNFEGECGVIYDQPIAAFQGHHMRLDTCGEPWSSAGPLRTIAGIAFIIGTGVVVLRMVTRAFGLRSFAVAGTRAGLDD